MMAGHQLADAAEHRLLRAEIAEGKILGQRGVVERGRDGRVLEQTRPDK
jgi:hypothetical protein